ncbi:MAG: acylphosphatase [Bacteroidetes bacterium]|jgi:acylphosphatase|nr:acylphosphatase [Bacteroidota bacterium]
MKRISIHVSGKVQGVFFRATTQKVAIRIGLSGFVRNETDGKVFIEAQGTAEQLNEFVKWCKDGPERARVDEIITKEISFVEESGFLIVR